MKKIVTLSLAFSALVFSAQAQQQRDVKKKDKNKMEHHQGRHQDGRHDMMQELNLTEAQKTQLKANREAFKAKMDLLKTESLTEAQRNERKKALMAEQKAKMEAILTPEQKAQLLSKRNMAGQQGQYEGKKRMHGDKQEMMKEKLALTDEQAAKLKAQRETLKQKKLAIKNDTTLFAEARKAKMKDLHNEAAELRKSVLTADQLRKMEEMKKEHKNKHPKKTKK